jgi:Flp pilus assembly protein TadD
MPDEVVALTNYGAVLDTLQRFNEALASYDKALAISPDWADALYNRARTLRSLARFEEALACYDRAVLLTADKPQLFFNRGTLLGELKRFEEAVESYERAIALKPDFTKAHLNRALLMINLEKTEEALTGLDRALSIEPNNAAALNARGFAFQILGRHEEAIGCYDSALLIEPNDAQTHHNRSMALLLKGDFERGLPEYEWRWETGQTFKQKFPRPQWLGNGSISEKAIILHGEQGFGDIIMAMRYVPQVVATNAKVILAAPPPLIPLMRQVKGVSGIFGPDEKLPPFDFHCPFMSLPLALGATLATIPNARYIFAEPDRVVKWKERIKDVRLPKVGIVWSGSQIHKNDRNRSIDLQKFSPFSAGEVELVSLQRDLRSNDIDALRNLPIRHFGEEINDVADTAALISLMDLVISVDTSAAHLAGAMGKPVWILLPFFPDWRWLLDREDSPWYPTAKLYRQQVSETWDEVIERAAADLFNIFGKKDALHVYRKR